jgi:hypothetical protein
MNAREVFMKLDTESSAVALAKAVSSGAIESPLTRAEWLAVLTANAESNIEDPELSPPQKFAHRHADWERTFLGEQTGSPWQPRRRIQRWATC